jgi:hypothetical protein
VKRSLERDVADLSILKVTLKVVLQLVTCLVFRLMATLVAIAGSMPGLSVRFCIVRVYR